MALQLSLLSPGFLGLSVVAVVLLAGLDGGARQAAFLTLNLAFLWFLLLGPTGTVTAVAFCLIGLVFVRVVTVSRGWGFRLCLVATVAMFVYASNYDFLHWALPESWLTNVLRTAGLSFLFFKIVHVLIEARSDTLGPLTPVTFVNYCLNFSTFLMGPIQRYQDYHAQWHGAKEAIPLSFGAHLDAVTRIVLGLVKAYVLGAWLQPYALGPGWDLGSASAARLLVGTYIFYVYLYLNFAGYCDVVIGIGSLFGVRPPENFNKPFLARNVSDFWLRMHRSLTLWLTDYVFAPSYKANLSSRWLGSRSLTALSLSLFTTMIVCGLWHGTTLSFFLFGIAHGAYLVVFRIWDSGLTQWLGKKRVGELRSRWPARIGGMVLTFNAVAFAFVFFQLDASSAFMVFERLLGIA